VADKTLFLKIIKQRSRQVLVQLRAAIPAYRYITGQEKLVSRLNIEKFDLYDSMENEKFESLSVPRLQSLLEAYGYKQTNSAIS